MSVSALFLGACGASEAPLPPIASVNPSRMASDECIQLVVDLEAGLPLKVDYGAGSAEVFTSAQVGIADQRFTVVQVEDQARRLTAELLGGLPVGVQDLRVRLEDNREVVRPGGVEITAPLMITGFNFDYVRDQLRQLPFTLVVQATGPDAERFQGRVRLRSNHGRLEPAWSEPFVNGVLVQRIVIDGTDRANVLIELEDCGGRTAHSNEFRVDSEP